MRLPFTKMHGLGNDFAVIDCVSQPLQPNAEQIAALADRHLGIGFDQLLLIEAGSSDQAEFRYRIFNADGSEVEHCGNGARCFAKYVHDKGLTQSNPVLVETVNRVLSLQLSQDGLVSVNMGAPNFDPASLPLQRKEEAQSYKTTVTMAGQDCQFSSLRCLWAIPTRLSLLKTAKRQRSRQSDPRSANTPTFRRVSTWVSYR